MLEVVNSLSDKSLLIRSKLFEESNISSIEFFLNMGDISKLQIIKRRKVFNKYINIRKNLDDFLLKLISNKNIRIWFSSVDSEETCFMYFIISQIHKHLNDEKISIIDVSILNQPRLGGFDKEEIKDLLRLERELSLDEIKKISIEWGKLVEINSDLRLVEDKKLVSHTYECLDEKILKKLSKYDEVELYYFVGLELMPRGLCSVYGDFMFHYRINEMIKSNKIRIIDENKLTIKNNVI